MAEGRRGGGAEGRKGGGAEGRKGGGRGREGDIDRAKGERGELQPSIKPNVPTSCSIRGLQRAYSQRGEM